MQSNRIINLNSDVSVIVPFHGNVTDMASCLGSLATAEPAPREIIVVLDGDMEASVSALPKIGARFLSTDSPSPLGPAVARNMGARAATGSILLFIDADVTVGLTLIGDVERVLDESPEISGIIGSYDNAPAAKNAVSMFRNLLHHHVHQHGCKQATTFWGACGAIRQKDFVAAGGFDELFCRPSIEDIELGYRLHSMGRKLLLCKELQIKHLKQWRLRSMLRTDLLDRAVPWTRLMLRDHHFGHELNLGHCHRASVIFSYMLAVSLFIAVLQPLFLVLVVLAALSLILMNSGFLRFSFEKHGGLFSLQCLALIWLHYISAGLGFMLGLLLGKLSSTTGAMPALSPVVVVEPERVYRSEPTPELA